MNKYKVIRLLKEVVEELEDKEDGFGFYTAVSASRIPSISYLYRVKRKKKSKKKKKK